MKPGEEEKCYKSYDKIMLKGNAVETMKNSLINII